MALTVRNVVEQFYRYLRREQRGIPFDGAAEPDLDDPLPEALLAINGALQEMAVLCPVFAARGVRSAFFHAPVEVAVTGLTNGGKTMDAPAAWADWMAGCAVQLPGDEHGNRMLGCDGTQVALQFPHLSSHASGSAKVTADAAALDADVIRVLPVVRSRDGVPLHAANGRFDLRRDARLERSDFGRWRRGGGPGGEGMSYYVESLAGPGGAGRRLCLMVNPAPEADLVLEFEARTALGWFTAADVYAVGEDAAQPESLIPVPGQFVESIFLPMALWRFLSSSVMRNTDIPPYVQDQVKKAAELLGKMRPQAEKNGRFEPGW